MTQLAFDAHHAALAAAAPASTVVVPLGRGNGRVSRPSGVSLARLGNLAGWELHRRPETVNAQRSAVSTDRAPSWHGAAVG